MELAQSSTKSSQRSSSHGSTFFSSRENDARHILARDVERPAHLRFVPAPHARDFALRELMKMDELQHQDGFRILRRERALESPGADKFRRGFSLVAFSGCGSAIEKIVGRIRGGGDFDAKALPPFQIDQPMRRHGEEP